jgi:hypothetical protein
MNGCAMKSFYIVEVDGSQKPLFPGLCVVCGMPGAERPVYITVTDEGSRVDFYLYKLPFRPAQGPQLEVPVHDSCAKGIRNTFLKQAGVIVLAAALIIGSVGIYGKAPGIAFTAAFAIFAGFFILQAWKKVPFEFNRDRTGYILMFGERSYAEKVAALNGTKVRTGTDASSGR